jgi:large subunit ribosomal protein L21
MYAVVDIAGSQYKVQEGDHIRVARIDAEEGASLTLPDVLLVGGGSDEIKVGTPQVEGAAVEALVKGHGRADKITVFKMKRRKTYRRKNGHRQSYTELQIEKIVA